jgi:hypothetical protein
MRCSCGKTTLPASSLQGKEITMGHLHMMLLHPIFINKVDYFMEMKEDEKEKQA